MFGFPDPFQQDFGGGKGFGKTPGEQRPKFKTLLFQKDIPGQIGDQRTQCVDEAGCFVRPDDNNCEVAATVLDIEWKGVQAGIKSKHVTMGFGLAHRSSELSAMRMEDLCAIAPLDGDRDHWKAILNAVREVNI